jgi:hypothetical protein
MECPHPEILLQYIRERQDEPKKAITSDDMVRGGPKAEGDGPLIATEQRAPMNEMPENCPFCKESAEFRPVGDDFEMDCRDCLIAVTFDATAAAMECQNPAATLEHIRKQMRLGVSRPVVTSVDMRR